MDMYIIRSSAVPTVLMMMKVRTCDDDLVDFTRHVPLLCSLLDCLVSKNKTWRNGAKDLD